MIGIIDVGEVDGLSAIKYGMEISIWLILIGVIGGFISFIGFLIAGTGMGILGNLIGGVLFFVGGLIILGGMFGILYKVIIDAMVESNPQ